MTNRLSNSNSPYLLQHAGNPVDWYPWGEEALGKARAEDKPIFLSIGYAACHWCHVMAHESFDDPQTAALMNETFVNIKVDREERPDIDSIYMSAVTSITGQGGWPLSVFLDAQGRPFYGGTYFPPQRRYNLPGFAELVQTIGRLWREDRQELLNSAENITQHLQEQQPVGWVDTPLERATLNQAAQALDAGYDWQNGGWGSAPKFPQPMAIEFLLRRACRLENAEKATVDDSSRRAAHSAERRMALHALHVMARGGMYDVVGGGFARYSTDASWLVPHFEKMLYDNAQLARVYLHGYMLSGEGSLRRICEETLDFIARELCGPCTSDSEIAGETTDRGEITSSGDSRGEITSGGFFSSLDADSDGEEGKYYLWTSEEIHQALSSAVAAQYVANATGQVTNTPVPVQETETPASEKTIFFPAILDAFDFFSAAYGLFAPANFEGRYVLQRMLDDQQLSKQFQLERFNLSTADVPALLAVLHRRLLSARGQRVRPATDDKVLTSWNALALTAFAEAARYLKRPDYLEIARRNADFLLTELNPQDRLLRSWRAGQAQHDAYLEDHAALILGLLALYQSDPDPYWFNSALELGREIIDHFLDPSGGFFDTRADGETLLLRPKDIQDNATPSGSALAVQALLELSAFTGDGEMRHHAERALRSVTPYLARYPTAFAKWLSALDSALYPPQEVAILGDPQDTRTQALVDVVWSRLRPQVVLAVSDYPTPENAPALLHRRTLVNGLPTAYVCQNLACQRPVTDAEGLQELLFG